MSISTRRTWLQTMLGALTSVTLASCRDSDSELSDVCIVGSGPAGAILASELVGRGVRTVVLEGGLIPTRRTITPTDDSFQVSARTPIPYPVDLTRFMGDGGTSNVWTGRCPRFQPMDFSGKNPYAPPENPWPLSYETLEPYYTRAERALSIGGAAGTTFSPPRSSGFPFPPVSGAVADCLIPLAAQHGLALEICPAAHAPRVAETHLPKVTGAAAGLLVRDAKVVSIEVNDHGEVSSVAARSLDGSTRSFRARTYVIAAGGIETPRLLLLCRPPQQPRGIGNQFDLVGRHFCEHLGTPIGTFEIPASICGTAGVEQAVSWQFYPSLKGEGLGAAILEFTLDPARRELTVSAVFEMKPSAANRVILSERDSDSFGLPAAEVVIAMSDAEQRTFAGVQACGAEIARRLQVKQLTANTGEVGWCHHHMCSCRMGTDARSSVVDADLRVHGFENLYVSGSSTFVTIGAGSPTLLLSALTIRLADHLAARFRRL